MSQGNCLGGTKVTGQVRAIGTSPDGRVVVGTSKGEVLELTFNAGNPEATTATSLVQYVAAWHCCVALLAVVPRRCRSCVVPVLS